ncbi:unnamed protein product [Cylindrotheca closterium]|uniref:Uncharacterized protein n=1 Tax=Cylindrotheca closterium TaxID=2856 RepID=A0AAD2JGM3_9STRA|nr:unnamed protein product [Cylindrotheca closterium]
MIVTTMAVTESNTLGCAQTSSNAKQDYVSKKQVALKPNIRKPNIPTRSYSEIDRLLDASEAGDESGHSETEAYDETIEPVSSAEFIVDLSRLTPEEVASLLKRTKEDGERRRAENANNVRQMQVKLTNLESKLKKKLAMTSMAPYTQAMKTDMPLPTYVTANQKQLCRAFHVHEVYMNQTKKMQKKNKKLLSFLKKQIKLLQEDSKRREASLQDEVTESRAEVVKMCRVLEINPEDWKRPGENELMKKVSEVLSGVPMLGEWARSFSEGSTRSLSQSCSQGSS